MIRAKSDHLGLAMIGASLLVILLITGLLFRYQRESRREQVRVQGVSLARLLSSLPFESLAPSQEQPAVLQVLAQTQDTRGFAYAVVVDSAGSPLAQVTSPGTLIPPLSPSAQPSLWLTERELPAPGGRGRLREFTAPLLSGGDLAGYVRVGYRDPEYAAGLEQVPFFATLALPIFLLVPLFHLLVKREVRPLTEVSRQLQEQLETQQLQGVEVRASGTLQDFVQRFNRFVQMAEDHVHELELKERRMLTSTRLLSYQKARVESALQAMPDAAVVLDETGAVTFANAKVEALLGVDPRSLPGKAPPEWCPEGDLSTFFSQYAQNTALSYRSESVECSAPSAPDRRIVLNAYPLFSPRGSDDVFGTLVVCRDATGEMLAKQAHNEFVGHVAHEFKSPLNVLGMYGELLSGEQGKDEAVRIEAANVITDEVDRLTTLIHNLLNMTKIEVGGVSLNRQRVKLSELLRDAFDTAQRDRRATHLEFRLDLPQELSPAFLDKDMVRIAVNNLLTNAIKYNRPGGSVTLTADETDEEIRIRVRDTGIGIAPGDQPRVFEKFFRSAAEEVRQRPGNGLGLSLAKEIVELHHGRIDVDSRPGEGTEFTVTLRKSEALLRRAV